MIGELVYLASPYSHPDPAVKEQRYRDALKVLADLTKSGVVAYSPIVHSHPMARDHDLAGDWKFWDRIDRVFLSRCSKMIVAKLEGWDVSIGVHAEIIMAQEFGIPVEYMEF